MMGRPTVAEVDLAALRFNLKQVRELTKGQAEILAVVKANAYGHGAVPVVQELYSAGVRIFGVASVEEGVELRRSGVSLPILVLGGIHGRELEEVIQNGLTPVLFDLDTARALDAEAGKAQKYFPVHVKIDTGMNRLGVPWREWGQTIDLFRSLKNLRVEGLMSHLSAAESEQPRDQAFTEEQIRRFQVCLNHARQVGIQPRYVHLANSAAMLLWERVLFNLVRPGLMLYGVHPSAALQGRLPLRPAMRWKTEILFLKRVPAGDPVSYGRTYSCERDALIATLPVGYADGYSRRLSNRAEVLIRGRRAKVVGAVCMDLAMVDVSEIPGVRVGDEAVLLGKQESEEISASEMAGWAGTIPYEVLCAIGKRVPRRYLKGEL